MITKEKLASATCSISGITSILGSWQICHNLCLGIIAVLSILGIASVGMPLMFLTTIALPVWIIAVVIFFVSLGIYMRKRCMSKNMLFINAGLIIAGIPLKQEWTSLFMSIGGIIIILTLTSMIKERRKTHEK